MRIAVIGAGVSGLACARQLQQAGEEVILFEKSRGFGGRCATRRLGEFIFDTGATSICPRGLSIEDVILNQLPQEELHRITQPVWTMDFGRINAGDASRSAMARYCYTQGISTLGKLLAQDLDVRLETRIEQISKSGEQFEVNGELFDVVVLTAPLPQSQELLQKLGDPRNLSEVGYRPCLSIMLGFDAELPVKPYHALVDPEQMSPMIWLSLESQKCPGRAPTGKTALIAQIGPQYSRDHYEDSEAELVHEAMVHIRRLFGNQLGAPTVSQVMRWRYAQPETHWTFEEINLPGERVLVIGDGVAGARIELAYESGIIAANHIKNL